MPRCQYHLKYALAYRALNGFRLPDIFSANTASRCRRKLFRYDIADVATASDTGYEDEVHFDDEIKSLLSKMRSDTEAAWRLH